MRIAVWHNLPSGGAKRALYDHVRGLVQRGHTVESWCPPTADQTYLPLSELVTEHVVPSAAKSRGPTRSLSNLIRMRGYSVQMMREVDEFARQAAAEINQKDFDLLLANSSISVAVSSIARHVRTRTVLYLQEPYRYLYEARPHLPWVALPNQKRSLREAVRVRGLRLQAGEEWTNARAFDALLVNSNYSRESILRIYGIDATVCYLGVDTTLFVNQNLPREDFVLGVGAIAARKNVHGVIEALARVRAPRPALIWIGDSAIPSYLEDVSRMAGELGVEFLAKVRVDDATLVDHLNRAMLMVYAPRLEPFGFAPLEAGACGLPVVAIAEGGVKETVLDGINGLVVDPNPASIATAIEALAGNKAEARRLGEGGCKLVAERWSVAAAVDRLEQNLTKVLANPETNRPRLTD